MNQTRDWHPSARRYLPSQYLQHRIEPENIGVHSEARDQTLGCIRENAVYVTLGNAADVHLHIWQARAFDAVLQCVTGVGKSCRIHDEPAYTLIHRLIDAVDLLALDIRV